LTFDARLAIKISSPKPDNMSKQQRVFLDAIRDRIERKGLRVLEDLAASANAEDLMTRFQLCHGVVVLAFGQWKAERLHRAQDASVILPSEFSHIESVMAAACKRPLLVLREKSLAERGVLRSGYLSHVVKMPNSLRPDWIESAEFEREFDKWAQDVACFRHIFLGYSSQATETGNLLFKYLSEDLKLRVFDWHDFRTGHSIWESIEQAEHFTNCGLFLFMADDKLAVGSKREFAPRDNVVYEAGYFAGAKGRKASLIIREEDAKIPSDLGGILYLKLVNRRDISSIEKPLRDELERMLVG
jgi:predicted nucleotide-binding protein